MFDEQSLLLRGPRHIPPPAHASPPTALPLHFDYCLQVRQHAKELWQSQHAAQTARSAVARRKEGGRPQADIKQEGKAAAAAPQAAKS